MRARAGGIRVCGGATGKGRPRHAASCFFNHSAPVPTRCILLPRLPLVPAGASLARAVQRRSQRSLSYLEGVFFMLIAEVRKVAQVELKL